MAVIFDLSNTCISNKFDKKIVQFSYSRDVVLRYIMELSSEGDEIYKNYLSNFEEEQPVGEWILTDRCVEI